MGMCEECWNCGADLDEYPPEKNGRDRYCVVCESHWIESGEKRRCN